MYTLLTGAVALLMAIAAGVGLFVEGIYRDNPLVQASWFGNDLATLVLAVPLLGASGFLAHRGSERGLLLSLGLMAYAVYNFAFYLFGAAFNSCFLLYAAIVALSTLGLIAGLTSSRLRDVVRSVTLTSVDRSVGVLVTLVSLSLGAFWVALSLRYVFTGEVPAMVEETGHPTNLIGALDLWLIVTFGLIGGTWLSLGRAWGYVVSVVWTVKGAVYMAALGSATVSAYRLREVDSLDQLGVWIVVGVVNATCALVLLRASRPTT